MVNEQKINLNGADNGYTREGWFVSECGFSLFDYLIKDAPTKEKEIIQKVRKTWADDERSRKFYESIQNTHENKHKDSPRS